ncbi:MAG: hypothetical protein ACI9JO_001459, partial [Psychrobacter okhotskensis]
DLNNLAGNDIKRPIVFLMTISLVIAVSQYKI